LAVWPEEACRREWQEKDWARFATSVGCSVVSGFSRRTTSERYNSVVVADASHVEYYDKHFVVVGCETASPLDWIIGVPRRRGLRASGAKPRVLQCSGLNVAVPICFEISIPKGIAGRPDLIVNPGSELRIANGNGTQAMLDHARLRAIEARRSVVRAVRAGWTSIIDGNGKILAMRVNENVMGDVPLDRRWSLYAVIGDWITLASCAACALVLRARRDRETTEDAR
jgi:apolipoprotein N-acyltransferase